MVQLGEESEIEFHQVLFEAPRPSAMDKFPTKERPNDRYKFTSFSMFFSLDLKVTERSTYSILE